ncbi:hypothetical protein C2G38_2026641 [Gigaspora rosea]|uniref:Uncharacterized protein n=1 Tax=Gigaspora rosea TaxID=44941 RepID=A0A397WAQ5_9GLOM|nr:hypothetical protein C2G38_2026641 [Gigaspora rosea]
MSGKTRQLKTKETEVKPRNINFCELVDNNEANSTEIYNVDEDIMPKATKRPVDPNWNTILRERKISKLQKPETNNTRQKTDITQGIDSERRPISEKLKRKRGLSVVDNLSPYDVTEDILSLPAIATVGQMLQYLNQRKNWLVY